MSAFVPLAPMVRCSMARLPWSELGHSRRFPPPAASSAVPSTSRILCSNRDVRALGHDEKCACGRLLSPWRLIGSFVLACLIQTSSRYGRLGQGILNAAIVGGTSTDRAAVAVACYRQVRCSGK